MILKAKLITKENSTEFSNMFLDDIIECASHIKLGGMYFTENQLICLSYIKLILILMGPVTNISKLLCQMLSVCSATSMLVSSTYFKKDIRP